MRTGFPRVYKSFADFEKEELEKLDMTSSIDDMLGEMFTSELDPSASMPIRPERVRARSEAG